MPPGLYLHVTIVPVANFLGPMHRTFYTKLHRADQGADANTSTSSQDMPGQPTKVDVKALMSADPRFIARLIQQLDAQMHAMQDEKKRRERSMTEDHAEIERINKEISTHVQPQLVEYIFLLHSLLLNSMCLVKMVHYCPLHLSVMVPAAHVDVMT